MAQGEKGRKGPMYGADLGEASASSFLRLWLWDRETAVSFVTITVSMRGGRLMADWQAIKTEYITTDTSYRKLAQKFGVNVTNIAKKASAESWVKQRKQYASETQSKTIEKISKQEANRAARIHTVADKLLNKIEAMVDRPELLNEKAIRSLTAAVKDLKEIQSIKSDLDEQEQRARIANLQKQAEKDDSGSDAPTLVVEGLPEEFKV